ncbi:MAG: PTS transporter subunit EIIB [Bacteroidales bacterium]
MIIKLDIETPGREKEGDVQALKTKADFKAQKAGKKGAKDADFQNRLNILVESLGGVENLTSVNACITKLRLQVADNSVIDFDRIKKETGAMGFSGQKGKSPMIVYGAEAEKFKTAILEMK